MPRGIKKVIKEIPPKALKEITKTITYTCPDCSQEYIEKVTAPVISASGYLCFNDLSPMNRSISR